jgi:aldehyde dehydrogenase (NAD+)
MATASFRDIFEKQKATALAWRTSTAKQRIERLKRLRAAVLGAKELWYEAGRADYRKPPAEVDVFEIMPAVLEANDAIRNLKAWMKPKSVWPTMLLLGTSSSIRYEPRGRSLIISPWNYPVNLTFGPLASALAAGNPVIIKPSELTPNHSAAIARVVKETFAEEEVAVVEGDASVAQALLELPFEHFFFTGSPGIGKVVMAAAAKHLASVTLELGGRNPTVVDKTADLDMAARSLMWSSFGNGGQMCVSPDHIFVESSVKAAFIERCRAALTASFGAEASDQRESPNFARIVSVRHTQRIASLLEDAVARGAKVVVGGAVDVDACSIAPTLLDDVPQGARILQEEVFGPVRPIIGYTDLDDVIRRINDEPKPLALYIWSRDERTIDRVTTRTSSGGACINHTVAQFIHLNLPFGGVNNSGIGNAHGYYGFRAFSHERGIVRSRLPIGQLFFPPYGAFIRRLVDFLCRFA